MSIKPKKKWVPFTPSGSMLAHLASNTKKKAISKLCREAGHMMYAGVWEKMEARGYTVELVDT